MLRALINVFNITTALRSCWHGLGSSESLVRPVASKMEWEGCEMYPPNAPEHSRWCVQHDLEA